MWRVGLTTEKMFHRLTLMRFPAPPFSRLPGTRTMSLDWHFGHFFVFFITAPPPIVDDRQVQKHFRVALVVLDRETLRILRVFFTQALERGPMLRTISANSPVSRAVA